MCELILLKKMFSNHQGQTPDGVLLGILFESCNHPKAFLLELAFVEMKTHNYHNKRIIS